MKKIIFFAVCCFISFLTKAQNVGISNTTSTEKLQMVSNVKTETFKLNNLQLSHNRGLEFWGKY